MKKDLLYSLWLLMSVLILSSFTDGPDNATKGKINGHEYVDLGLPSGVKWATCNVGASKPEEYGGYYAWGETEEKSNYEWSTYKWCNGSSESKTKYCTNGRYGTVDNKTVLDPEDDVAHVKWGGTWRMPTKAELYELHRNCTWSWITQNGVNGYKVTGPNGNSIFLPAAGYRVGTGVIRGGNGHYWSSLGCNNSDYAFYLSFYSGNYNRHDYDLRYFGCSVRPVSTGNEPARKVSSASKNTGEPLSDLANRKVIGAIVKPECNFDEEGTIIVDITVTPKGKVIKAEVNTKQTICANPNLRNAALAAARQTRFNEVEEVEEQKGTITYNFRLITKISGKINGHEYIDLGLPSGLKWATCNVGALSPEEYGDYYAWGETEQKKDYCIETYKWFDSSNMMTTKYCTDSSNGIVDNKTTLDSQDDVAHVKWGGTWRMPTEAEQDELRNICTWTWTTQNGVNGYKVTGPNGNSIFLPAAGSRVGDYWSSSLVSDGSSYAYNLYFHSGIHGCGNDDRYNGRSVRPVSTGDSSQQLVGKKETAEQKTQVAKNDVTKKLTTKIVVVADVNYSKDAGVAKMSGKFENNKSKLPIPITGSYLLVDKFGQNKSLEGKGNVMINNQGLTFKGTKGAQARAVFEGVVSTVFYHNDYTLVLIRHENYISVYSNLKNVRVKSGDAVKAGDIIADVTPDAEDGNPTLLFQLYKEKTLLDPTDWLRL